MMTSTGTVDLDTLMMALRLSDKRYICRNCMWVGNINDINFRMIGHDMMDCPACRRGRTASMSELEVEFYAATS